MMQKADLSELSSDVPDSIFFSVSYSPRTQACRFITSSERLRMYPPGSKL